MEIVRSKGSPSHAGRNQKRGHRLMLTGIIALLSGGLLGGCTSFGSAPKPAPPLQASQDTAQIVATSATVDNLLLRGILQGNAPGAQTTAPQAVIPVPGIQVTHTAALRFYDASGQEQPAFDSQTTSRVEGTVQTRLQYTLPHWRGQAELQRTLTAAQLLTAPLINGEHQFNGTLHFENDAATVQRDYSAHYSGVYRNIAYASREALFPSSGVLEYDLQLNGSVQGTDHDGQFTLTAHAVLTFTGGETAQLVLVVNDGVEQRYTVNLLAGTATAARA